MTEGLRRSMLRLARLFDQGARALRHLAERADGFGDRAAHLLDRDPLRRFLDHPVHLAGDHSLDRADGGVGEVRIDGGEASGEIAERAGHQCHRPLEGDVVSAGLLHKVYSRWLREAHATLTPWRVQAGIDDPIGRFLADHGMKV